MLRRVHLSILLCLLLATSARATHISGGEIYYDCLGGNQYLITLVVYRDCAGINLDNSYTLDLTSPCANKTLTVSTSGGVEISQLCGLELPNSTCNGGSLPGIQQYIYTGTVSLPPCDAWTISWTEPWRNGAIANLVDPGNKDVYIQAVLNNAAGPCNDSPHFTNTAIPYVCASYPITYSYGAIDPEGDSLTYTFISAMNDGAVILPYVAGFSGAQPITGITLDPHTGEVNFTLNSIGNWVVVVRVDQYDASGTWVGSIMRDMQFIAYPCTNVPPDPNSGVITGLTGAATQTGPRSLEVCESGDFCFDAEVTDLNAGDTLTGITNISASLPGATISYSGSNPMSMHVCWTGVANASGFFPFIITVSDGACPIPAQQTFVYSVHVLPGISLTSSVTNETCAGNGDGTATVNVDVGQAPFTYLWSTGATTAGITAGAGEYQVVVSDANGCMSHTDTAMIGSEPANTANAGPDLNGCFSALPVTLNGAVTGGVWSGGAGAYTGTGLNVTYMPTPAEIAANGVDLILTTTATGGCPPDQDTTHLTLSSSFFGSTLAKTNASCFGSTTGVIVFTPDMPGLSYLWNDPAAQTTATASGLAAGSYAVDVTDSLGCDTTLLASITQPAAITLTSLTMLPEQCTGSADGSITAHPAGGTLPYHYSWSNGDTTATITVGAGTYSVSVTDANGCDAATGSTTVTTLGQTNIADAGPDITGCFGQLPVHLNGTVTHATGGIWSGGSGNFTGMGLNVDYSPSPAEIAAHGVDLYLTTSGNTSCPSDQDTLHVVLSTSFFGSAITAINANCNNTASGSAVFTPDDPALALLWTDPSAQTTATASGLMAGDYAVHVTDSLGCDTTLNTTISEPAPLAITGLAAVPEQCAGNNDGSISATVTGGTAPYHYSWSNGDTTALITVGAGTYLLTVTDANGCAQVTDSAMVISLGQPNGADAGADIIGCYSSLPVQLHGTVMNATGGAWSGGTGSFSGIGLDVSYLPSPAEIAANSVDLVLSTTGNITCASAQDSVHITLPTSFFGSSMGAMKVFCAGDSTGTAAFTPNDPTFTYLWNDPWAQTGPIATGLPAGSFSVHVTDSYGCDTTATAVITEPLPLAIGNQVTVDPSCFGSTNGSVTVLVNGGVLNYSYAWSVNAGGQTASTITGLGAGSYFLTVTDANGCQLQDTATLVVPPAVLLEATVPDTVCVNAPVPLVAQASGGSGGYVITWAGIGTGDSLMHAFPASQPISVSVTDQAGCTGPVLNFVVHVLDFSLASLHTYGDTVICPGESAIVSAAVTGYPGGHSIAWTELDTTGNGPFIVPTTDDRVLNVVATDQCGNTLQDSVSIDVQTPPSITLPPLIAKGCAPLTVHFPDGLTNQPVSYLWDLGDGSTSTSITPVHVYPSGDYTVSLTVSTPIGCTADALTTGAIHSYALPVAEFSADPWETDADHGSIPFTDLTAGAPSTWSWTFGDGGTAEDADPTHTYTEPGTYTVVLHVEDIHGCGSDAAHDVLIDPVYTVIIPNAFTPDPNGGSDGNYDPNDLSNNIFYPFLRFAKDLRMRVFNRWGELVFETNDIHHGWDGYYKGKLCQQDVYVYQLWVRFVDGKEVQETGDITLFR
jgi:gliding motility-associated-like protein